ncbi:hypothetical protein E2562_021421 [Oryza meyeriana var. granulata]|uniref:Uncharacterized protein n=1 Tax=Oryza meyeriana var. granulata TaxID=110450 RepID=A0A6G1EXN3_9ORYZ|nr:hypothetical protein E2562_021421 [Oryza meyeriana var. granulata]
MWAPLSDEGGSSDGVLVELPSQEARSPGADPDGGVLVNMPADDTTSGETFEDAPDDLAMGGSRSARSLDESIAVIDFPDESSIAAECRKYKEEREVFARETVALRRMLWELVGEEALVSVPAEDSDERVLASPTPLHSMLDDCSRLVLELNSVVRAREQEIESLRGRSAEVEVSREVVDAYLGSSREGSELAIGRIIASVDAVVGQYDVSSEGADEHGISLVERKTSLLAERYRQILLGIEQLEQVLAEVKPDFVATGKCDHATILGIVLEELVCSKRNEADFLQKMNTFGEENKNLSEELQTVKAALDAANAEAKKAKAEFEQMEHKLLTTKEKLSMAVTKGKSLVQHRDSLKQALAEKTAQLDGCMAELQQKSDAMQAAESRVEELKASLSAKDEILQHIEEVMSEASFPEDMLSLEMTDRLEWLVEQKKIADMIFSEHRKVKDILDSADLPHGVLTGELDSQIQWLLNSLYQAKEDATRMQDESSGMLHKLASHESKLNSMHEEVDRLTIALLEEKQEKDILANEHAEFMSLYNAASDKLSVVSSQYTELVKAFAEVSDVQLEGNEILDDAKLVEQCLINIQGRAKSSPVECEGFEKLQTQIYTLDQELTLYKIILEEDKVDRSEMMRLSGELQRMEREGLKKVLDEKNSDIEKLKLALDEKNAELDNLKQTLDGNNSVLEKLKQAWDELNSESENIKQALDVKNSEEHEQYVKRVFVLEKDLETLKDECKGMEIKIQEYQEREKMLKAKDLELVSLEHMQSTTDRGMTEVFSKDQLEALTEKINKLNISSAESHLQRELAMSSSPIDKLFSLIDEVDALRHEVDTLRYENEDLHLNFESHAREMQQLKEASRNSDSNRRELESKSSELLEVTVSMERMIQRLGYLAGKEALEDNKPTSTQALLSKLEKLVVASNMESGNAKSVIQELGAKLQAREKSIDELSTKLKMFDDLHHVRLAQPEANIDRAFEASSSAVGSEISDTEDLGPAGKASISSVPTAAHSRIMRKGSSDHLVLNIGRESERLITAQDSDDKGRVFKSLHTSGMVPAQGKQIADRVDGIWEPNSNEPASCKARTHVVLALLASMVDRQHLVTIACQ